MELNKITLIMDEKIRGDPIQNSEKKRLNFGIFLGITKNKSKHLGNIECC